MCEGIQQRQVDMLYKVCTMFHFYFFFLSFFFLKPDLWPLKLSPGLMWTSTLECLLSRGAANNFGPHRQVLVWDSLHYKEPVISGSLGDNLVHRAVPRHTRF